MDEMRLLLKVVPHPTMVQLCSVDEFGYENNEHIVAIAGDWIFDSNKTHALPLSAESLDACCLDGDKFLRVSYAVRFIPGKKLLKRKRDVN